MEQSVNMKPTNQFAKARIEERKQIEKELLEQVKGAVYESSVPQVKGVNFYKKDKEVSKAFFTVVFDYRARQVSIGEIKRIAKATNSTFYLMSVWHSRIEEYSTIDLFFYPKRKVKWRVCGDCGLESSSLKRDGDICSVCSQQGLNEQVNEPFEQGDYMLPSEREQVEQLAYEQRESESEDY